MRKSEKNARDRPMIRLIRVIQPISQPSVLDDIKLQSFVSEMNWDRVRIAVGLLSDADNRISLCAEHETIMMRHLIFILNLKHLSFCIQQV